MNTLTINAAAGHVTEASSWRGAWRRAGAVVAVLVLAGMAHAMRWAGLLIL